MSSTTGERLHLLHEHIRLSLLGRRRALSTGAQPNNRTTNEISRSLDTLHHGIEQLDRELRQLENAGTLSPEAQQNRVDELNKLRTDYTELQAEFAADIAPVLPERTGELLIDIGHPEALNEDTARSALMGSRLSPGGPRKTSKTVRFRDTLVDTEEMENQQVLELHQQVIGEQDESLDRLTTSIRNQRELSIQIGDELDQHVQLLDEFDGLVDRHHEGLNNAKKRLDHVANAAREHGSLMIILILIIVLVLLIAILK